MTTAAVNHEGIPRFYRFDQEIVCHSLASQAAEASISFYKAGAISVRTLHELSFRFRLRGTPTVVHTNSEGKGSQAVHSRRL